MFQFVDEFNDFPSSFCRDHPEAIGVLEKSMKGPLIYG
jgi:hypothetical protein